MDTCREIERREGMNYCLTITLKSRIIWRGRVIEGAESRLATDRPGTNPIGERKTEKA